MKKQISTILALSLFSSVLVGCSSDTEQMTQVVNTATAVEVLSVTKSDIANTVKLSGKITPIREVSVFSMMTSEVEKLSVQVGDRVSKNDFLFSVEEYPTTDLVREINNLKQTYDSTQELLIEAEEQIEKALNDTRALYAIGASSRYEVEQLEFSLTQQQSTNKTQLDSLTNTLAQLNSQLKDLNDNAKVYAPISGVVTQVNVIENMLATNSYAAVVIADDSQMQIQLSIAETIVPYLKAGNIVSVTIPSMSSQPFDAEISIVSPSTNAQTGMYTTTINLPSDKDYFIGMFAEVTFVTDQVFDTVNIPSNAIINGDDYSYVYVVSNSVARRVEVETGITDGANTQIISGLLGNELLVVTGQEYLSDNSLVNTQGGEE